jgi:hypothetical protein
LRNDPPLVLAAPGNTGGRRIMMMLPKNFLNPLFHPAEAGILQPTTPSDAEQKITGDTAVIPAPFFIKLQWLPYMFSILHLKFTYKMILAGIVSAPWIYYVERYVFNDWNLLVSLVLLIGLDTATGIWRALKRRDPEKKGFTKKGFGKIINKLIVYVGWLLLIGVLEKAAIHGKPSLLNEWIHTGAISILMIREAISAGENLLAIRPDGRLKKIVNKLSDFLEKDEKPTTPDKPADTN